MKPTTSIRPTLPRPVRRRAAFESRDIETARLAKALAHPARVAIVRKLIACGECICGAIVSDLPLAQATVSQHLKVLKEAGVIRGEVDGPRVCYCIDPGALERLRQRIQEL